MNMHTALLTADYANYLEDFINTIDNLPNEIRHIYSELKEKDIEYTGFKEAIHSQDISLRKLIRNTPNDAPVEKKPNDTTQETPSQAPAPSSSTTSTTDVKQSLVQTDGSKSEASNLAKILTMEQKNMYDDVQNQFKDAVEIASEKIKLADRALAMLDRHIKRLTSDLIKIAEHEGFSVPNLPTSHSNSSLHLVTPSAAVTTTPSVAPSAALPQATPTHHTSTISGSNGVSAASEARTTSTTATPVPSLVVHEAPDHPTSPATRHMRPPPSHKKQPKSLKRKSSSNLLALDGPTGMIPEPGTGNDDDSVVYCVCRQVSFGNMIACDGDDCPYEWFHYPCVNLSESPTGLWYCPDCSKKHQKKPPGSGNSRPRHK